jgi:sporulation protein YlmC with PRC-barrel domain
MAERQTGSVLETRPRREETVDLMRAHDIRDIKARNPEGERLGDISDIAIDRDSGRIAYAVLSYGGILGFGEKHFAIPWEAVRTRSGEKVAVLDADKRTLDSTPGFSRDRMPREGDWSLIRTPPTRGAMEPQAPVAEREVPPSREMEQAAPAESTLTSAQRNVPVPPPVQTVAGGWGGQPTGRRAEERPVRTEAPPRETVVEEVRRERPVEMEARPRETVVEEVRREQPVEMEAPPRETVVEEVRREQPVEMEARPVTEMERPAMTPGPSPGHLSAADLQVYLKGMDYPAGRQDLIGRARQNNAPESVTTVLERFSDRTYRSAADVSAEFGSEARSRQPTGMGTTVEEVHEERPEARGVVPSRAHLSAADLQSYLKGMDYPAGKQDLITHARGRSAPESVTTVLEGFSDRTYQSAADVSVEFGRESRGEHPSGMGARPRETVVEEVTREHPIETETRPGGTVVEEVHRESPVARRAAPSLAHLSAADLQVYLKGMDYPAGKQDLITHARERSAPEDVITALERFGDRTYQSAADVGTEFGKIK